MKLSLILFVFLSFWISPVYGHSGKLDSYGCHRDSKSYHCYHPSSEMKRTPAGRNRLRCDLDSQSKDCEETRSRNKNTYTPKPL